MKFLSIAAIVLPLSLVALSGCSRSEGHSIEGGEEQRKIVVTSPEVNDVISTEQYVCQIHSRRHIELCAMESGYLQPISVQEGQTVKQGDLLFKIVPTLYQAKLDAEAAEAQLAQIEFDNTKKLFDSHVVSDQEVALAQAKLAKAQAQVQLARTELSFTEIKAPFDGIIDRLHEQQGSLIEEGDMLTSLSDNSVMWVYFNVPEARYLEYQAEMNQKDDEQAYPDRDNAKNDDLSIELVLANGNTFDHAGEINAIEADFNNETGNIAFRADFPNPDNLLRHGQTGNVLIHHVVHGAIVIPQRATFEILDKRYVFLVGEDNIVHQHEIKVRHEMEDIYVIEEGVKEGDKLVLEGVREVRDGAAVEYEFRAPEEVLSDLKNKAE
jgi:membrane fusion protein (multidrug efflux system)